MYYCNQKIKFRDRFGNIEIYKCGHKAIKDGKCKKHVKKDK